MHKKIKHIIAVTLIVTAVSCALPTNYFVLGSITAQAETYKSAANGELNSLTLTRSTGSEIQFGDTYGSHDSSLTRNKDYYVELTGADGFQISASVQGSGYVVKQFASASKTEQGQDVGKYIKVDSTYDDIYLRTYKSEQAYQEAYDNEDVTECEETYILHIKKPTVISDEELFAEYAYLKSIYLSAGSINFSKDVTTYNLNVNDNVQEILVRATPEDDDYSVSINDYSVDKDSNYEKTIKLDKGNNEIKIDVESNDDKETYTLNVYRGNTSASSTSENQTSVSKTNAQNFAIQSNVGQFNSWQRVDGKWKYIDGTGETLKNQWWFDKNTGKSYYLESDGSMATGWLSNNNSWYYFNENGEMQTGWICLDRNWYYLNKSGVMQMGWLEDSSGNWYYLDSSGVMKTGWVENSDGKWYYFDSTGKMAKNSTINGSNLGSDGALEN